MGDAWAEKYFQFTVLHFGLVSAPFLFTKIQKVLVKHWRKQGFQLFTYFDDGAGAEDNFQDAQRKFDRMYEQVSLWPMMKRASGDQFSAESFWDL